MIRLTPAARKQLELITELESVTTGFFSGMVIGKHTVVQEFLPVNFNGDNIDEVYAKVFEKIGEKLLGTFFKDKHFFFNDWFEGDMVLQIGEQNQFLSYQTIKEGK